MQATGFCSSWCLPVVGEQTHQPAWKHVTPGGWSSLELLERVVATSRQEHRSQEQRRSCPTPARGCSPTLTHPKLGPRVLTALQASEAELAAPWIPQPARCCQDTELSGPFSCAARRGAGSKTAWAKKKVFTGPLAQATWLSQLAHVKKIKHNSALVKKSILRNQFFRNSDLRWHFLQILFPLPDRTD